MKKEIELIDYSARTTATIALIVALAFGCYFIFTMPQKVCETTYTWEEINVGCVIGGTDIPANLERHCDEGVMGSTEAVNYKGIVWYCGHDETPKTCHIRYEEEVCELR
jgi:hypothetical protein